MEVMMRDEVSIFDKQTFITSPRFRVLAVRSYFDFSIFNT
jgi:hypothetical protein